MTSVERVLGYCAVQPERGSGTAGSANSSLDGNIRDHSATGKSTSARALSRALEHAEGSDVGGGVHGGGRSSTQPLEGVPLRSSRRRSQSADGGAPRGWPRSATLEFDNVQVRSLEPPAHAVCAWLAYKLDLSAGDCCLASASLIAPQGRDGAEAPRGTPQAHALLFTFIKGACDLVVHPLTRRPVPRRRATARACPSC